MGRRVRKCGQLVLQRLVDDEARALRLLLRHLLALHRQLKLAAELEAGDFSTVEKDALEQVACGAMVLDVNSGAVFTNRMATDPRYADNNFVEPPLMRELILRIQAIVDVPLCIDSSVPGALEAGLLACEGRHCVQCPEVCSGAAGYSHATSRASGRRWRRALSRRECTDPSSD